MGTGCASDGQARLETRTLELPHGTMRLELARTVEERTHGLSGRPCLARDEGMLFLFESDDVRPFWMKDMRCAIDILYLRQGVVKEVFADVPFPASNTSPKTVHPREKTDMVLEIAAGEAARRNWALDTLLFAPEAVR